MLIFIQHKPVIRHMMAYDPTDIVWPLSGNFYELKFVVVILLVYRFMQKIILIIIITIRELVCGLKFKIFHCIHGNGTKVLYKIMQKHNKWNFKARYISSNKPEPFGSLCSLLFVIISSRHSFCSLSSISPFKSVQPNLIQTNKIFYFFWNFGSFTLPKWSTCAKFSSYMPLLIY